MDNKQNHKFRRNCHCRGNQHSCKKSKQVVEAPNEYNFIKNFKLLKIYV